MHPSSYKFWGPIPYVPDTADTKLEATTPSPSPKQLVAQGKKRVIYSDLITKNRSDSNILVRVKESKTQAYTEKSSKPMHDYNSQLQTVSEENSSLHWIHLGSLLKHY